MADFAKNIKKIRESKNMTQRTFGAKFGVSEQTVSNWKNGSDTKLKDLILNHYHISIDYLLGKANDVKKLENKLVEIRELLQKTLDDFDWMIDSNE